MILLGFLVFGVGVLVSTYGGNIRIGYGLGLIGFVMAFLGVVAGNWIMSRLAGMGAHGRVHRLAIAGFCVTVAGIIAGEFFPDAGAIVVVGGLCMIFLSAISALLRINRNAEPESRPTGSVEKVEKEPGSNKS